MTKCSPKTSFIVASILGAMAILPIGLTHTAFADNENLAAQPSQAQQGSSTGPYDGADFEAAKRAFN
jgi:hypothetical protein